jgi:hypothetical protein
MWKQTEANTILAVLFVVRFPFFPFFPFFSFFLLTSRFSAYGGCALDSGWARGADGEPYCFLHINMLSNSMCVECNKIITSDLVTFNGEKRHAKCFVCAFCQNPLAKGKFFKFDDQAFCYGKTKDVMSSFLVLREQLLECHKFVVFQCCLFVVQEKLTGIFTMPKSNEKIVVFKGVSHFAVCLSRWTLFLSS